MISCTLNETLPKSAIIRELDDNIKKYGAEVISDKDIIRVATRIANRNLKNLEELNKIADTSGEEFVKRLQKEADIEREESEKRMREFQEIIQRLVKKEKQMDDVRDNYKTKLHEAKTTQSEAIDKVNKQSTVLEEEKKKRLKAENDLIKIKRDKYFKDKLKSWRRRNWVELVIGVCAFLGGIIWMMFKSEWDMNKAMTLFVVLNKNLLFSAVLWLGGLIFSIVTLRSLVDKYRNHSNIKSFLDNIEKHDLPEEFKDKKE